MLTEVILVAGAVVLGTLYFMKRSARLRKQARKDF
jgi:hypothetical protein